MKKSQLAINSVSIRHAQLEEALAAYHDAGFENVEFTLRHVKAYLSHGHTLADVRRLLDQSKLRCIGGFECCVECFSPVEPRAKNHELIVQNARLLADLGASAMVVGTDGPADWTKAADPLGEMARVFAGISEQIQDTGVTICIEFNWSPIVKSLRTAAEIARRSQAKNVGVLFDPAHYHCTPTKADQLDAENVRFIKHVHVNDMRDKPGELSQCNADRVLPGAGCLDLKALFGALEKHGYKGCFSIEMFNDELWAMPAAQAAKLMYNSLLPLCQVE
ncbi:MAG: sugar phosphate isomerase/epimerase [Verrucomicrobia bacterium]|nr:sugar phosphate isomerase/epimerase [Verrucomicrobiota bacterium]